MQFLLSLDLLPYQLISKPVYRKLAIGFIHGHFWTVWLEFYRDPFSIRMVPWSLVILFTISFFYTTCKQFNEIYWSNNYKTIRIYLFHSNHLLILPWFLSWFKLHVENWILKQNTLEASTRRRRCFQIIPQLFKSKSNSKRMYSKISRQIGGNSSVTLLDTGRDTKKYHWNIYWNNRWNTKYKQTVKEVLKW